MVRMRYTRIYQNAAELPSITQDLSLLYNRLHVTEQTYKSLHFESLMQRTFLNPRHPIPTCSNNSSIIDTDCLSHTPVSTRLTTTPLFIRYISSTKIDRHKISKIISIFITHCPSLISRPAPMSKDIHSRKESAITYFIRQHNPRNS